MIKVFNKFEMMMSQDMRNDIKSQYFILFFSKFYYRKNQRKDLSFS